jgi:hypothetical protein
MKTPRRSLSWTWVPVLACALAAPRSTRAQEKPQDDEAQRLFIEGRDAIERGDYAAGCPKFEESLKLVTRASTLLNLAQCDERDGRLVRAFERWKQGAALLDPIDERVPIAKERALALEKRIPQLTIRMAESAPPGTEVKLDGALVGPDDFGAARPLDPGRHVVTLNAPKQPAQELTVELAEGSQKEVFLQPGSPIREVVVQKVGGSGTTRTLGLVIGGLGVAGAVVAGITGGLIISRDGDIQDACPNQRCTKEGEDLIDGSQTLLIVNGIAWGVGLVGLGVGAWLVLSSGDDGAPKTTVGTAVLRGGAGLTLRRSF